MGSPALIPNTHLANLLIIFLLSGEGKHTLFPTFNCMLVLVGRLGYWPRIGTGRSQVIIKIPKSDSPLTDPSKYKNRKLDFTDSGNCQCSALPSCNSASWVSKCSVVPCALCVVTHSTKTLNPSSVSWDFPRTWALAISVSIGFLGLHKRETPHSGVATASPRTVANPRTVIRLPLHCSL